MSKVLKSMLLVFTISFILSSCIKHDFNPPSDRFIQFAEEIKKEGWIPDMERLKNVGIYPELSRVKFFFFEEKPFFNIDLNETQIERVREELNDETYQVFKKVKNIWGYFYRRKKDKHTISDGVIEEWQFASKNDAVISFDEIKKIGGNLVFFNTTPYFLVRDRSLYIFHTRAMAFSYDQKYIFEKF